MTCIGEDAVNVFRQTGAKMAAAGLIYGTAGNISLRVDGDGGFLITSRGCDLANLTESEIIEVDVTGQPKPEQKPPSSEAPLHAALYAARPDIRAIVHSHSAFATALAAAHIEIPPFLDEILYAVGGPVRVAEYGFPGTFELAQNAVRALAGRQAALLANHGAVAVGSSLDEAFKTARLVEAVAQTLVYARLAGGEKPLPPAALEKQIADFHRRRNNPTG